MIEFLILIFSETKHHHSEDRCDSMVKNLEEVDEGTCQVEEKVAGKLEDEVFVPNLEEEAFSELLGEVTSRLVGEVGSPLVIEVSCPLVSEVSSPSWSSLGLPIQTHTAVT